MISLPLGVQLREDACQVGLKYCINKQSSQTEAIAMPSQYRQNYTPNRPLPRWLQRLINWL